MFKTIQNAIYAYKGVYYDRKTPTLIYSPGRVGSMGLTKNLREAKVFCLKVEFIRTVNRGTTKFVKKHILNAGRPAKIITLVRDPMAIMVSYFLSKCAKGWIPEGHEALERNDIEKLKRLFIEKVLQTERLDSHLYWFENEFIPFLKLSPFDTPFDHSSKSQRMQTERFSILILRTELHDHQKEGLVNDFLNTTKIHITRENEAKDKPYASIHEAFKKQLHIPAELLEKIYSAPYATHFFSPEEIRLLKAQWS